MIVSLTIKTRNKNANKQDLTKPREEIACHNLQARKGIQGNLHAPLESIMYSSSMENHWHITQSWQANCDADDLSFLTIKSLSLMYFLIRLVDSDHLTCFIILGNCPGVLSLSLSPHLCRKLERIGTSTTATAVSDVLQRHYWFYEFLWNTFRS